MAEESKGSGHPTRDQSWGEPSGDVVLGKVQILEVGSLAGRIGLILGSVEKAVAGDRVVGIGQARVFSPVEVLRQGLSLAIALDARAAIRSDQADFVRSSEHFPRSNPDQSGFSL